LKSRASLPVAFFLLSLMAAPLRAERKDDVGPPPPDCDEGLQARLQITSTGLPLKGGSIRLSAAMSKLAFVNSACLTVSVFGIPSSVPVVWSVAPPAGAQPTLSGANTLAATLTLPVSGDYRVRFTVCPGGCDVPTGFLGIKHLDESFAETTIKAVDSITLPPERLPAVPKFANAASDPTAFPWSNREIWCLYGGGTVDPQWVSVNDWGGADDYVMAEGTVHRANIAHADTFNNHDSMDFNFAFRPDPHHFRVLSTEPEFSSDRYLMGVEWERAHYPEHVWPTVGDRVSVFGYWIFDCGHAPYYTEIHPAVGIAVHRPRAVRIPDSATVLYNCPPRAPFRATVGTNVLVPGIVTEIWFNSRSGEITSNCSWTGLHQKGVLVPDPQHPGSFVAVAGECIRGPAPLRRVFEFNIFLPRSSQLIYREAGQARPDVPLYLEVSQVASLPGPGQPGPDPVVQLIPRGGDAQNDYEYLRVSIDLRNFSGESYSRRITAAWAFPSTDNWGVKSWRVSMPSMDIHDDSDTNYVVADNDGDWRLFMNLQTGYQEWSRLFDCDGCAHGVETFNPPWSTGASDSFFFRSLGSTDPSHRLGPDLLLYAGQPIWVHASGFEQDCIFHDDTGRVTTTLFALAQDANLRSYGEDGQYTLRLRIREGPAVPAATLSSDARTCIADPYKITAGGGIRFPFERFEGLTMTLEGANPGTAPGLGARPPFKVDGTQDGALFGQSVAGAGDVNSDGYADVLIGAPIESRDDRGEGLARLYLGHRDGVSSEPLWIGESNQTGSSYGFSVAGAGDVNGDGYADILVGAPGYDNGGTIVKLPFGRAFLHLGSPAGPAGQPDWQSAGGSGFGYSVASAGDVDGDGLDDVIVGAPGATVNDRTGQGAAFLFLGSKQGLSPQPSWAFAGELAGARLGFSVAGAGDVNGDGRSDVIVGAPEHSSRRLKGGKVYLFLGQAGRTPLGSAPAWSYESDELVALLGASVAGAGDVNGDGVADLIVGMPGYFFDDVQTELGLAQVFLGRRGGVPLATAAWTRVGQAAGSKLGTVVGSAGDLNGDGYADIFVSAPGVNLGESGEGAVFAFLGAANGPSTEPAWRVEGDQQNAFLGTGAAGAGDIQRDGFADVLMGAPGHDPPYDVISAGRDPKFGRVYALYGWGPKEVRVRDVAYLEPDEPEFHSLVYLPLEELVDLFETRGDEPKVKALHQSFLAEFDAALQGPNRVDAIDEIATLHAAFPSALWDRYFEKYQLFMRGDANRDRRADISDGIHILTALFGGGSVSCLDAGDVNDDGMLDISDPIALLGFLFTGATRRPAYPFEEPGLDPTIDGLGCVKY